MTVINNGRPLGWAFVSLCSLWHFLFCICFHASRGWSLTFCGFHIADHFASYYLPKLAICRHCVWLMVLFRFMWQTQNEEWDLEYIVREAKNAKPINDDDRGIIISMPWLRSCSVIRIRIGRNILPFYLNFCIEIWWNDVCRRKTYSIGTDEGVGLLAKGHS